VDRFIAVVSGAVYFFISTGCVAAALTTSLTRDSGVTFKFVEHDCMLQDFLRMRNFPHQGRCGEIMAE
jgi:hypothetical protein